MSMSSLRRFGGGWSCVCRVEGAVVSVFVELMLVVEGLAIDLRIARVDVRDDGEVIFMLEGERGCSGDTALVRGEATMVNLRVHSFSLGHCVDTDAGLTRDGLESSFQTDPPPAQPWYPDSFLCLTLTSFSSELLLEQDEASDSALQALIIQTT
jgi:hypothetical protein